MKTIPLMVLLAFYFLIKTSKDDTEFNLINFILWSRDNEFAIDLTKETEESNLQIGIARNVGAFAAVYIILNLNGRIVLGGTYLKMTVESIDENFTNSVIKRVRYLN
jgi:hypothetical protein